MPPSRPVSFNPAIDHNDGLLVNSVMRRHGLTYESAAKAVADEVDTMKHQLSAHGEVGLGRLGYFSRGNGDSPIFTPGDSSIVASRWQALPSLSLAPVIEMARREAEQSVIDNNEDIAKANIIKVPLGRRLARIAASIAIILGLGIALTTPIVHEIDTQVNYASVSTPSTIKHTATSESSFTMPGDVEINIATPAESEGTSLLDTIFRNRYQRDARIMAEIAEKRRLKKEAMLKAVEEARLEKIEKERVKAENNRVIASLKAGDNDPYCLVISSHGSKAEAKRFIKRHGGQSTMKILVQDGRYRVYIASSTSQDQIQSLKDKVGTKYPGAWMCARK